MSTIAWIVLGLAAGLIALLAYGLVIRRATPARRGGGSSGSNRPRGYGSGTPVLVRAEKRLYQDEDRQSPAAGCRVYPDKSLL